MRLELSAFKNLELVDFSVPENRASMKEAIALVRSQLGREYDMVIGGNHLKSVDKFQSFNPSLKSEVVGVFQRGTEDLIEPAMEAAERAFESWEPNTCGRPRQAGSGGCPSAARAAF